MDTHRRPYRSPTETPGVGRGRVFGRRVRLIIEENRWGVTTVGSRSKRAVELSWGWGIL